MPNLKNVLWVVLDDVGRDKLFPEHETNPPAPDLPTIDSLRQRGVLFENAWTYPVCGPSRACMQTGRLGFRTGMGDNHRARGGQPSGPLPLGEQLLPEYLDANQSGCRHALFGKWHLGFAAHLGVPQDPQNPGWSRFAGTKGNFDERASPPEHYEHWLRWSDGSSAVSTRHATVDIVESALSWIRTGGPQPWVACLSFQAAHQPFQRPPGSSLPAPFPERTDQRWPYFHAMIEHIDRELGRMLAELEEEDPEFFDNTTVILLADNGTPSGLGVRQLVFPPYDAARAKGTLYEGGIRVPLVVAGAGVASPGRSSNALVHAVDLFATIAELCGAPVPPDPSPAGQAMDGRSFVQVLQDPSGAGRPFLYSEFFTPNHVRIPGSSPHRRAIRNQRWKLIRRTGQTPETEFYDLLLDPFEESNLFPPASQQHTTALRRLEAQMNALLGGN